MAAKNPGRFPEIPTSHIDEEINKPWNLSDPYRFAPNRPDGDPWKILLDPLLEKEKIQCDGWKDEVGNLLIFAGLFSAVITAFIIDSYKTLKPDPNDDIVALLSRISNQLNNSNPAGVSVGITTQVESLSAQLPSQTFSPTHSAVRINVLWFLSLILSLAVVLVGIVSLQWLRQHQAFPGQSPRDALALYRMRSEGMQKWHVWKILMALPLLLQIALVLFFVGIVDFLHSLGNNAVLASGAAAIGATLLFLLATTTLPAIQTLLLPVRLLFSRRLKPPSQCPYKSPQSNVVCGLVDLVLRVSGYVVERLRPEGKRTSSRVRRHLSALWATKTWIDFDLTWLKVRNACSQNIYEERFGVRLNMADADNDAEKGDSRVNPPLFDTMDVFRCFTRKDFDQTLTSEMISATYYCISELSNALTVGKIRHGKDLKGEVEDIKQRNRYFRYSYDEQFETLEFIEETAQAGSSSGVPNLASDTVRLLHDQNLCIFLDHVGGGGGLDSLGGAANDIFIHRQELKVRIQQYMLGSKASLLVKAGPPYPSYLEFKHDRNLWNNFPRQEQVFLHQYIHVVREFFDYASRPGTVISPTDLQARAEIMNFLEDSSRAISNIATQLVLRQSPGHTQASEAFIKLLDALSTNLGRLQNAVRNGRQRDPEDLLHMLYCAGMFACGYSFRGSRDSPTEQAYYRLMGVVKSFMKNSQSPTTAAENTVDLGIEKQFRFNFPNDAVVDRHLSEAMHYDGGGGTGDNGQGHIPFEVSRVLGPGMPVPQYYGQPRGNVWI